MTTAGGMPNAVPAMLATGCTLQQLYTGILYSACFIKNSCCSTCGPLKPSMSLLYFSMTSALAALTCFSERPIPHVQAAIVHCKHTRTSWRHSSKFCTFTHKFLPSTNCIYALQCLLEVSSVIVFVLVVPHGTTRLEFAPCQTPQPEPHFLFEES